MKKELSRDSVCIFGIIYVIAIYHFIAANKVLLNKITIIHKNVATISFYLCKN